MMKDKTKVLDRIRQRTTPEQKIFAKKNLSISKQISELLIQKGWSQKDFAQVLGKHESEVSKLLSGMHNFSLMSLAKMEAVLGSEIIVTPIEACVRYETIKYVTLKVKATTNKLIQQVEPLEELTVKYRRTSYSLVS